MSTIGSDEMYELLELWTRVRSAHAFHRRVTSDFPVLRDEIRKFVENCREKIVTLAEKLSDDEIQRVMILLAEGGRRKNVRQAFNKQLKIEMRMGLAT